MTYETCDLCPRACGVDRTRGERGACRMTSRLVLARAALHYWEEPCISGTAGSGTVFFSGCPLGCVYCQNREIADGSHGLAVDDGRLEEIFFELRDAGAHNINLVTPTHFAPTVAKAIRLLDLLAERTKPATLTELYQATGWPKSTIHGLLSTMREAGLIEQTPNGRYWLGIRLFEYGCAVSNAWDIGSIARPHMQKICAELGESVFLSVFDRAAVVTLAEEESRASLRVVSEVGARLPIHCTSQGKLFLANLSQAECRRLLSISEFKSYTPHTLTSSEQLQPELQKIREQGYAVENGEYKVGLRSVSAPVRDASGEVRYAIGVVGMFRQVYSEDFLLATRLVCEAGSAISRAIGYRP